MTVVEVSSATGTGIVVLAVSGELDVANVAAFSAECDRRAAARSGPVVLRLEDLDFVDSSALGALVRLHEGLRGQGRRLVLVGVKPQLRRIMEITGLTGLFEMSDDIDTFYSDLAGEDGATGEMDPPEQGVVPAG